MVVKIPMTWQGIAATQILAEENIKVNLTLVFNPNQALLAAKAGAAYVSPFWGRLEDRAQGGLETMREIVEMYKVWRFDTRIILASIRSARQVAEAALIGADIATVPFGILKKMFSDPLTNQGLTDFDKAAAESGQVIE